MRFEIKENKPLTEAVWDLCLAGKTSAIKRPGQFVQVALPGFYLRRPISVCEWEPGALRLVYKVLGQGTAAMTAMKPGEGLDLLTGLGNGFDTDALGEKPLLIGGGVGLPPLLGLAKALLKSGRKPCVLAGFNRADEVFLLEDFKALDVRVEITTMDGSMGIKGLVTDALPFLDFDSLAACGPLPMLKAVHRAAADIPAQYSLEERMGCGFGACMGCTIQTASGPARVCKEGPVFPGEELMWT